MVCMAESALRSESLVTFCCIQPQHHQGTCLRILQSAKHSRFFFYNVNHMQMTLCQQPGQLERHAIDEMIQLHLGFWGCVVAACCYFALLICL